MPNRVILILAGLCSGLGGLAAPPGPTGPDKPGKLAMEKVQDNDDGGPAYRLNVRFAGRAPNRAGAIEDERLWAVAVQSEPGAPWKSIPVQKVECSTISPAPGKPCGYSAAGEPSRQWSVNLLLPRTELPTGAVSAWTWDVRYTAADLRLSSVWVGTDTQKDKAGGGFLKAAKSKDDADLYLFGSFLAGESTKPIYVLDAKVGTYWRIGPKGLWAPASVVPCTGFRWGLGGTATVNPDAEPPADRTRIDPNAISAYAQVEAACLLPRNGPFDYFGVIVQPVKGEFARKYPTSNLISAGEVRFFSKAFEKAMTFDPRVGYEVGSNKNRPATLFKRPVDLSNYGSIRRLLFGGTANYYFFQSKVTNDLPYRFVVSGSYQGRALFAPEPFTTLAYLPDSTGKITRQKVVAMRSNVRHWVQASVAWTPNPYVGVKAEYRYGSLPPLFQFVGHQVTVGLTFKAAYGNSPKLSR